MRTAPQSNYVAGDPLPCCGCALSFGLNNDAEICACSCHETHKFWMRVPASFRSPDHTTKGEQ